MKPRHQDDYVIERYLQDEKTMILLFAQWCVNNDLDPLELYEKAYPDQPKNKALVEALNHTVDKGEAGSIAKESVISLLEMFGNVDLAFQVTQWKKSMVLNGKKDKEAGG